MITCNDIAQVKLLWPLFHFGTQICKPAVTSPIYSPSQPTLFQYILKYWLKVSTKLWWTTLWLFKETAVSHNLHETQHFLSPGTASCIVWESRSQKNLWSTRLTYIKNNFCKFNVFHKFLSYSFLRVIISILYKFQVSIGIQICGIAVIDHCGPHAEHLDIILFFQNVWKIKSADESITAAESSNVGSRNLFHSFEPDCNVHHSACRVLPWHSLVQYFHNILSLRESSTV